MRALIFANGQYCSPFPSLEPGMDDLVIAADGGSRHLQNTGTIPDAIIGDLDSTDPDLIETWERAGVEVIRYPVEKDQTDLELALLLAQDRGADEILVFGAVGGRLDMTFGNLTLLGHPDLKVPTTLICGREEVHLLKPGETLEVTGSPGETLSLIPLQPGSSRVSASGVAFPLENDTLRYGTTRGISNLLVKEIAQIELHDGLLAVVHTRSSFPKED
jgi:thiamine pyrophosphokinase